MSPPPSSGHSGRKLLPQLGLGACGGLQAGRLGKFRVFIGGCLVAMPKQFSSAPLKVIWRTRGSARSRLWRCCGPTGARSARSRAEGLELEAEPPCCHSVTAAASARALGGSGTAAEGPLFEDRKINPL